ncbi:hypothetical protein B0T14DRAFT_507169 [Immersiella caudata]|uniref:Uncharacterized protein n=1 Tax=Immersiella caudata TaxID=314043 RepID=A0AA39XGG1_9PEZI|nr:hypothetical protein B0T14DRAFT_507169 [Immersiella caudata]
MCRIVITKWELCSHDKTKKEDCRRQKEEDRRQRKKEDSFCGLGSLFTSGRQKIVCNAEPFTHIMAGKCGPCLRLPRPERPPRPDHRSRPPQRAYSKDYLDRPQPPPPLNIDKSKQPSRLPTQAAHPGVSHSWRSTTARVPVPASAPAYYSSKEQITPLPPLLSAPPRNNRRVLTTQPPSQPPSRPLPSLPEGALPSRIPRAQSQTGRRMAKVGSPPPATLSAPRKGKGKVRPPPRRPPIVSYRNEPTPFENDEGDEFARLVSNPTRAPTGEIPMIYKPAPGDVRLRGRR